jgi:molybdopterin-guanine dinucleotide biosynthesis protein B
MKVFGLAGWSGSGKTTLLKRLIPEITARGVSVSTIKHAHHAFDIDLPGKDSYEHRAAGATEVMISSVNRWAIVHELRGEAELLLAEILARMTPVDLVLIEGYKHAGHDKLEVHRAALGKPLLCAEDPEIVAVATDVALPGLNVPDIPLANIAAIADFVLEHCGIARARTKVD